MHGAAATNKMSTQVILAETILKKQDFIKFHSGCLKIAFSTLPISNLLKALHTLTRICGDSILICKIYKYLPIKIFKHTLEFGVAETLFLI